MDRLTERDSCGDVYVKQHDYITASEKLCEYEDLEQQGLLIRLPCKVGDILYQPTRNFVSEFRIRFIEISTCNNLFIHTNVVKGVNMTGEIFSEDCIGKNVFLTKEEAERALEERK